MDSSHKQGSVLGGILLISGCCIGAGMLGLPVISASIGFFPSLLMFFLVWAFMFVTGLLLLEVSLWYPSEVGIITMAKRTLGSFGQVVGWILFLFLFYSLMVAYIAGSGALVSDFLWNFSAYRIPHWAGSLGFILLFGALIYLGTGTVDRFNRLLMIGLILTYGILVGMGLGSVKFENLEYRNWKASLFVIPVMVVSFGYHNLIPSMKTYLQGDRKKLLLTLFFGSLIPLVVYLLWQLIIMGIVPLQTFTEALNNEELATQALVSTVGASWLALVADYFAFFSIVTSFLAVALSLVDFLADGCSIKKTSGRKVLLCCLALAPPFFFSLWQPMIFLSAITYAGAFGAVVLFGILPVLMVWSGRYRMGKKETLVPGGKFTLLVILLFSLMVISTKLADSLHWIDIKGYYDFTN